MAVTAPAGCVRVTRALSRLRPLSRLLKGATAGFCALTLITAVLASAPTASAIAKPIQSSIIVDAATGAVLSSSNADVVTQPASLTKMMTLYLLFESLQQGKIKLTDTLTFSTYAASRAATNLNVSGGDRIGVETAILSLVVRSANDAATAIGERLGGSEEGFAAKMTAKARQLGMTSTEFHNASGLPDPDQKTTARDMAVLGIALLRDFPQYYPYFSRYKFSYRGVNYSGHNRLLKSLKGADGIKTGYVRASGFNLVTSAEQNGRRLVGVVLGGETASIRDRKMAGLIQTAFATRGGTGATLMAKAPGSVSNKAMSDAVAAALSEPASSVADNSDSGDEDVETVAAAAPAATTATATAVKALADTSDDTAGMGDTGDLKPILKPGMQLAAALPKPVEAKPVETKQVETKPAVAKPVAAKATTTKKKQLSVDDQTTANVWKPGNAGYGIQVGAFSQYNGAQRAATRATKSLPKLLSDARVVIDQQKNAGNVLYRARVVGLSRGDAESACKHLKDCMVLKNENSLAMDSN